MIQLIYRYKAFFMTIFVLSALGLVLSMFGSAGTGGGMSMGAGGDTVATIDGEPVKTQELVATMESEFQDLESRLRMQADGSNPEMQKMMERYFRSQITPDRSLERLIKRKFYIHSAQKVGIAVAPEAIRDALEKDPTFQKDGKFDPVLYKDRVGAMAAKYESELAERIKFMTLSKLFESGLGAVTPKEREFEKQLNTKMNLETVEIRPQDLKDSINVSEDSVKGFLALPESKAKMESYFNRNISKYETKEQVHARHILIGEKTEEGGGEAKANAVLADIKSKKITFENAAETFSKDPSNAKKGGDLGFFEKGIMHPDFEKAAFALKSKGEIAGPVKTPFGYHIIELIDKKDASKKTLKDVELEVAKLVLIEEDKIAKTKQYLQSWTQGNSGPDEKTLKDKYAAAWSKQEWSPALSDQLGTITNAADYTADLLSLNAQNPILKKPIARGENFVLVRFAKDQKKEDEKKAEDKKTDSLVAEANEKIEQGFEYWLESRFKTLEKEERIRRSEKIIRSLSEQISQSMGS